MLWPHALSSQPFSRMAADSADSAGCSPGSGQRLMLLGALRYEYPGDAELHTLTQQTQQPLQAQQQHRNTL